MNKKKVAGDVEDNNMKHWWKNVIVSKMVGGVKVV
jgi:hypothetical protein